MITSTHRKFAWQKWIDPLNNNLSETEWPGFDTPARPEDVEYYDFSNGDTNVGIKDIDSDFFDKLASQIHKIHPVKVVSTRFGLLTVVESTTANSHFDFWVLHSNYPFNAEDGEIICNSPGVDAFTPMTRYRCRIGYTKSGLFNIPEAKEALTKALAERINKKYEVDLLPSFDEDTQKKVNDLTTELSSAGKNWAVYVLPNGNMEICESDQFNETFRSKVKLLEEAQKLVGGKVIKPV